MKKLLVFLLVTGGAFASLQFLPEGTRANIASLLGIGFLKDKIFLTLDPISKRAELLTIVEENLNALEASASPKKRAAARAATSAKTAATPAKSAAANALLATATPTPEKIERVIQETRTIINEIQQINDKSGVGTQIVSKVLNLDSNQSVPQLTPQQIEIICKKR